MFIFLKNFKFGVGVNLCALQLILTRIKSLLLATRCCSCWDLNWGVNPVKPRALPSGGQATGHTWWLLCPLLELPFFFPK